MAARRETTVKQHLTTIGSYLAQLGSSLDGLPLDQIAAVAERVDDRLGEMTDVDRHLADAVVAEPAQDVADHGSAGHRQQYLGRGQCQRLQPGTLAGGENHCLHSRCPVPPAQHSRSTGDVGIREVHICEPLGPSMVPGSV